MMLTKTLLHVCITVAFIPLSRAIVSVSSDPKPIKGPHTVQHRTYESEAFDSSGKHIEVFAAIPQHNTQKFPLIAFLHGYEGGGIEEQAAYFELLRSMAEFGYVIVAPRACNFGCFDHPKTLPNDPAGFGTYYEQQLLAIEWAKNQSNNGDKFFTPINWTGVGIAGHSMGGQGTLFTAAYNSSYHNIKAAVMMHPYTHSFPVPKIPYIVFTGAKDTTAPAESMALPIFMTTGDVPKGIVNKKDVGHHEPDILGYNPLLPQFSVAWFKIFLNEEPVSNGVNFTDLIFGEGAKSVCHGGDGIMVDSMCKAVSTSSNEVQVVLPRETTHEPNWTKITVYHSHPACGGNDIADRDTADIMGDLYFLIRSRATPLECVPNPPHQARCGNHSCGEIEALGNDLSLTKVDIEVESSVLQKAWNDLETYSHCDIKECTYNCSEATATFGCWNITTLMTREPACSHLDKKSLPTEWWAANLQLLITSPSTGFWYSTLAAGEGVTWRQLGEPTSIKKNCSDEIHFSSVESSGEDCFTNVGAKTGPSRNQKDRGWIDCYFATVLGPNTGFSYNRTGGYSQEKLQQLWNQAFDVCPKVVHENSNRAIKLAV